MRIIIADSRSSCLTRIPDRLKETVWEAARAASPECGPAVYQGKRTLGQISSMCEGQASDNQTLLFVSMSGKFPSWLQECPVKVIRAAVVPSLDFVSSPSGYSWLRRHLMNLSFHLLRRHAELYIAADAGTKQDIHRYYFIPKDRIEVADDSAALALFFRSAAGDSSCSAVYKAK